MQRNDIENAVELASDADTTHEDARGWYDSYGWHLSTEEAGDVVLQAVEYDWLDDDDDAVKKLRAEESEITQDEADSVVEAARGVRETAESICGLLDRAVEAYEAGDLESCRKALLSAYAAESEAGDAPATNSLASALLVPAGDN